MRFSVVGANAETGDDVVETIEAGSREEVEQIAHEKGILVTEIKEAGGEAAGMPEGSDGTGVAMVVDDGEPVESHVGSAVGGAGAKPMGLEPAKEGQKHGVITLNANTPGETAHSAEGHIPGAAHHEAAMEYHLLLNQSLYLLEAAVNKYIREGWEPQGGLTIGMSNNALQYFQAIVRKKK